MIAGTGVALPSRTLESAELEAQLGLPRGWIESRTGVRTRHVAPLGIATSDLAVEAGAHALRAAGLAAGDIGLVILATSTPDHLLPPTAPIVAHRLGASAGAFDLAGACTGFLFALDIAVRAIDGGLPGALVIGANVLSRRVDWSDPATAALFGDGAGAIALRAANRDARGEVGDTADADIGTTARLDKGVAVRALGGAFGSDGSMAEHVWIPAGGARTPLDAQLLADGAHLMRMDHGPDVFRAAVRAMVDAGSAALASAGIGAHEIDWLVPHQANRRLIERVADGLVIARERAIVNVDRVGNTSAASIPIALHEALTDGRIRDGHTTLLTAAGAGLGFGSMVLHWHSALTAKQCD